MFMNFKKCSLISENVSALKVVFVHPKIIHKFLKIFVNSRICSQNFKTVHEFEKCLWIKKILANFEEKVHWFEKKSAQNSNNVHEFANKKKRQKIKEKENKTWKW